MTPAWAICSFLCAFAVDASRSTSKVLVIWERAGCLLKRSSPFHSEESPCSFRQQVPDFPASPPACLPARCLPRAQEVMGHSGPGMLLQLASSSCCCCRFCLHGQRGSWSSMKRRRQAELGECVSACASSRLWTEPPLLCSGLSRAPLVGLDATSPPG